MDWKNNCRQKARSKNCTAPPILQRRNISTEHWLVLTTNFEQRFKRIADSTESYKRLCAFFVLSRQVNRSNSELLYSQTPFVDFLIKLPPSGRINAARQIILPHIPASISVKNHVKPANKRSILPIRQKHLASTRTDSKFALPTRCLSLSTPRLSSASKCSLHITCHSLVNSACSLLFRYDSTGYSAARPTNGLACVIIRVFVDYQ